MKNLMKSRKSLFIKLVRILVFIYLFIIYIILLDNIFCFDIDCRYISYIFFKDLIFYKYMLLYFLFLNC